jgi:hypothetical protein
MAIEPAILDREEGLWDVRGQRVQRNDPSIDSSQMGERIAFDIEQLRALGLVGGKVIERSTPSEGARRSPYPSETGDRDQNERECAGSDKSFYCQDFRSLGAVLSVPRARLYHLRGLG